MRQGTPRRVLSMVKTFNPLRAKGKALDFLMKIFNLNARGFLPGVTRIFANLFQAEEKLRAVEVYPSV